MNRIFNIFKKHKMVIFIASLSSILLIGLDMFNPIISGTFADRVIVHKDLSIVFKLLLFFFLITLFRGIFAFIRDYLLDYLGSQTVKRLKYELYSHIQTLSFNYFDNMNTGELMSRISEDVSLIWETIGYGIRIAVENIIYLITASIILFSINWKLTLMCLSMMPFLAFIVYRLQKFTVKNFEKLSDQATVLNTAAQENLAGVRLVKAFTREKYEILKFLKLNKERYELSLNQGKINSRYLPLLEALSNISMVVMIVGGGYFIIKENMTFGALVTYSGYIGMMIWPINSFGWLSNMISQCMASIKKINDIFLVKPDIKDPEATVPLNDFKGNIEFKNVFYTSNNMNILKDINIELKQGKTLAIMGATGSGKTSLINLISRFYDISSGEILLDGIDIKKLKLNDFRKHIAYVPQETFLFSDTIAENIRYGRESASLEEIKEACTLSCAMEFIDELEDGFETIIGERGLGLSGGQKQRLAIARALISDSKVLILDDATSSLDMETEYKLLNNLNKFKKRTMIIIAHRISAVKNADEIIYIENGSIVERKNHEELLAKKGLYYSIYKEQFKDFEDLKEVI